jgi:phage gpG-like protein
VRTFRSCAAFAAFLRVDAPARIAAGKAKGLTEAGAMIAKEMRGELGTYQSGDAGFEDWAPLAAGTLFGFGPLPGKIADGHATAEHHNPLMATGRLRDSIGVKVDGDAAAIGSDDPVAVYQNEGTDERGVPFKPGEKVAPGIPGREFVGRAGFRKAPEAAEAIGAAVVRELIK